MPVQYNFRSPRTNIDENLRALQVSNAEKHNRDLQAQADKRNRETNQFANIIGAGAAVVGGIYGGPQGAAAGYSLGSNVGRAMKGGQANAGEVLTAGASLYGAHQDMAQMDAEKETLRGFGNERDAALRGANPDTPELSAFPAPQTAADRLLAGAGRSPTPFKTALAGMQIANAMTPDRITQVPFGEGSTAALVTDAFGNYKQVIGTEKRERGATGTPRNVWINQAEEGQPAAWKQVVAINDNQVQSIQDLVGADRMSLTDPNKEGGQGEPRQAWVRQEDGSWKPQTATSTKDVQKLVTDFGADNVLLKDPAGGEGGVKQFQTFSPEAMDAPTFTRLIKTKGAKVDPQIMKSLQEGNVTGIDFSTLSQQINASPEEMETTKLAVIQDELKGNRWNDDAKVAARAYLKENTKRRTEALIDDLRVKFEADQKGFLANADKLQARYSGLQFVENKRLLGEVDRLQRGMSEAGAKEATEQDKLFNRGQEKLPPSLREGVKGLPPGQREKALDKKLGEQEQQRQRAEDYVKTQLEKRKSEDRETTIRAVRSQALRILGGFFTEEQKQQLLAGWGLNPPSTAAK